MTGAEREVKEGEIENDSGSDRKRENERYREWRRKREKMRDTVGGSEREIK